MSGRLLRKVLKEHEQNKKQVGDVISEELQENPVDDESDSDPHPINPFDLLNDNEDDHGNDQVLLLSCVTSPHFCKFCMPKTYLDVKPVKEWIL